MKLKLTVPLACQLENSEYKWIKWMLLGIVLSAFILRALFWDANPPALNQDEAMNGYNAYSLSKTLKDHRGYFLPAQVHAFGNIGLTSPLNTYLIIPFVALFGLSETTIRIPALLVNILLLVIVYSLCRRFFDNPLLAVLAAFLLSLNPWQFHYSRVSHEAALSPFFYTLIILLFYQAFTAERYLKYFIGGGLILGLSLYVYQIAFFLSPLIMLVMCLFYLKPLLRRWPAFLLSLALCFVVAFPLTWTLLISPDKTAESRFSDVTILNKPDALQQFLENYFSHFTNSFLYFNGDIGNLPYGNGTYGVFHSYMGVLLPMGVVFLIYHFFAERKYRRRILLVFLFVLLYPLPAALAKPCPHALRAYTLIPFFHIIAAAGLWLLVKAIYDLPAYGLSKKVTGVIKGVLYGLCTLFVLGFFGTFLYKYYFVYPKNPLNFSYYQYGMKEAITFVAAHEEQVDEVVFAAPVNQPFIYVLFYTQYDPLVFQGMEKEGSMAYFGYVSRFDKYHFVNAEEITVAKPRTLYVTDASVNVTGAQVLYSVVDPSGAVGLQVWGQPEIGIDADRVEYAN